MVSAVAGDLARKCWGPNGGFAPQCNLQGGQGGRSRAFQIIENNNCGIYNESLSIKHKAKSSHYKVVFGELMKIRIPTLGGKEKGARGATRKREVRSESVQNHCSNANHYGAP